MFLGDLIDRHPNSTGRLPATAAPRKHWLHALATGAICCLLPLASPFTAEQAATQQELDAVNAAIADIGDWLHAANARQSSTQQSLREVETDLSNLHQEVAQLNLAIAATGQRLSQLRQQQDGLEAARAGSAAILEQLLVAAYMRGESGLLRTLLNQEDRSAVNRSLHYARVFGDYQIAEIERFQSTLAALAEVAQEISGELAAQETQRSQLAATQAQLESGLAERTRALAALGEDIAKRNARLEQLEIERAELETLLEEIARATSRIRSFADIPPLDDFKGNLPPPVNGPILSRFGATYGGGNLTRQGVFIGTAEGTPVTAVHPGFVAFASWLQGQGLLVILDHGGGFVTLYGGNQALAVEAGQWVDLNDVIAISGTHATGGNAGLYFELRREGAAENPGQWLLDR